MTGHLARLIARQATPLTPRPSLPELLARPLVVHRAAAHRGPNAAPTRPPQTPAVTTAPAPTATPTQRLPVPAAEAAAPRRPQAERPALTPSAPLPSPAPEKRPTQRDHPVPRAPAPIAAAPLKRRDQPAGRDASPTAPITPASRIVHLDRIVDLRREHTTERTVVVRDRPITVRQTERERVVTTLPPAATPRREIARAAVAATQARQAPPAAAPGPVQVRIGRVELTVTAPPAPPAPAAPAGRRAPAAPGHPDLLAAHRHHLPRSVS